MSGSSCAISQPSEDDRHDAGGERRLELAERGRGRTVEHASVAVVARAVARAHVGGAVGAGDRARLVAADGVDRRRTWTRRCAPAGRRRPPTPPARRRRLRPTPIRRHRRRRRSPCSVRPTRRDRRRGCWAMSASQHLRHNPQTRRERRAGNRLTGSRAEPAPGNKYTRCGHYVVSADPKPGGRLLRPAALARSTPRQIVRDLRSVRVFRRRRDHRLECAGRLRNDASVFDSSRRCRLRREIIVSVRYPATAGLAYFFKFASPTPD